MPASGSWGSVPGNKNPLAFHVRLQSRPERYARQREWDRPFQSLQVRCRSRNPRQVLQRVLIRPAGVELPLMRPGQRELHAPAGIKHPLAGIKCPPAGVYPRYPLSLEVLPQWAVQQD